jgi:CBS domain-containing protein
VTLGEALPILVDSGLPALPVVRDDHSFCGIFFGEREVIAAVFPGYVQELDSARFIPHSIEAALERRGECVRETVGAHMNTEHIEVGADFAGVQLVETSLHRNVLVIPVTEAGAVIGVVARSAFAGALAERVLRR